MKKHIASVVLAIALGLTGNADAKTKIYKTNTDLPFVEMMMGMMVAMGILDKIPADLVGYGRYPASPLAPNYLGNDKYRLRQYLLNRRYGNRYRGGQYPGYGQSSLYPHRYGTSTSSFYQNPMLGFPGTSPLRRAPYNRGDLGRSDSWLPMRPSTCVGGSCISQRYKSLNGLWISEDGEMMGIKDDQFLWSDGLDNYMSGLMNIEEDRVIASIDGSNKQISYDYRVQGNELLTKDANGVIHRFYRYPVEPPPPYR